MASKMLNTCKLIKYCAGICFKVSKVYTVLRFILGFVSTFENFAITVLTSLIINELIYSDRDLSIKLILLLVGLFIIYGAGGVFNQVSVYAEEVFQQNLDVFLKEKIISKSVDMEIAQFDNPEYYDDFEVAVDSYHYINLIMQSVVNMVSAVIALFTAFIIVVKYNWIIGCVLVVTLIPYAIIDNEFVEKKFNVQKDSAIYSRKANYFFHLATARDHALEVRLYNIAGFLIEHFNYFSNKLLYEKRKIRKKIITMLSICENIPQCVIILFAILVVLDILAGKQNVGSFSLYIGMFLELKSQMVFFVATITDLRECLVHIDFFKNFIEHETECEQCGKEPICKIEKIEFKNVSFSYPNSEKLVLENVSFVVNRGETIGIVGLNGAGKSTLIKLLMRYYEVDKGEILINNMPLQQYDLKLYRQLISACFQSVNSYGFSLRDNILMAKGFTEKTRDKDIISSLEICNGGDILNKMPKGLDSFVTKYFDENGMELSGGQYQKLALARTYYRNSPLLILDEPSAALDPEAEEVIFNLTEKIAKENSGITIFVTHRLGNIKNTSKVLLLDEGKVLGFEPHDILITKSKKYNYLYNLQADKFK